MIGTGVNDVVTEDDVRRAVGESSGSRPGQAPGDPNGDQRQRVRRAVADYTTRSWRTIPHFALRLDADLTEGLKIGRPTTVICAAIVAALREHPECNLEWDEKGLRARGSIDVGLLVDGPNGLLLPVITNAEALSLAQMDDAIGAAADRGRTGQLSARDGGRRSLSLSNLGMFAVDGFSGIIAPPDVLLIAAGRVRTMPRWIDDAWQPRQDVELTLSVDHRALDGADGARLLTSLEAILSDPVALR